METETEDITSSINNLKSNYSRSRRRKRKTRGGYNKSRAGLATSPRTNSASRPLSPRDITPVIINGENISPVNEFDPISVPSPIMRPASPREAVPGESELRSPSLLRQLSPSPSSGTRFIGPASPTAFIPSELPSIAAEVPPTDDAEPENFVLPSIRSPTRESPIKTSENTSNDEISTLETTISTEPADDITVEFFHNTVGEDLLQKEGEKEKDQGLHQEGEEKREEEKIEGGEEKEEEKIEGGEEKEEEKIEDVAENVEHLDTISKENTSEEQNTTQPPKSEDTEENPNSDEITVSVEALKEENIEPAEEIVQTENPQEQEVKEPEPEQKTRTTKSQKGKKRAKKKQIKVKKYSSIPPMLAPVLYAPEIPDYSKMTPLEQEGWRTEFALKFRTLERNFGERWVNVDIKNEPLEVIHAHYERYLRHIHICSGADSYRGYLLLYFLILELVATRILGLPANGYTMAQMKSMTRYERLLLELGEKYYTPGGGEWAIEYRILFISLFNMVIFIVMNWLSKYIGEGASKALIDSIVGGASEGEGNGYLEDDGTDSPSNNSGGGGGGLDLNTILTGLGALMGNDGGAGLLSGLAGNNTQQEKPTREKRRRRGPRFQE